MKAVIQRVSEASVTVGGERISEIEHGFLVLLGVTASDGAEQADYLAYKTANLRIFEDSGEKLNLSLKNVDGAVLVVSNFTLAADCSSGHRPSFTAAARPEQAEPLYQRFIEKLKENDVKEVCGGKFRADMKVALVNDGPLTIWMDTEAMGR